MGIPHALHVLPPHPPDVRLRQLTHAGGRGSIVSSADSPGARHAPVYYCMGNPWRHAFIFAEIIAKSGRKPDDIMVLSNTIKRQVGRTPLKVFEHELAQRKIPVHLPLSDEHAVDEGVAAGKVLFRRFISRRGSRGGWSSCLVFRTTILFTLPRTQIQCERGWVRGGGGGHL